MRVKHRAGENNIESGKKKKKRWGCCLGSGRAEREKGNAGGRVVRKRIGINCTITGEQ